MIYRQSDFPETFISSRHVALRSNNILSYGVGWIFYRFGFRNRFYFYVGD